MNAIFKNSPIEGATTKERTIYIKETQRDNYLPIVILPPTSLDRPISFSEEDTYLVHFPYNDDLVMTVHIGCCKVSKIFIDGGSNVNILYNHTLDRMEDTPELA